MPDAAVFEELGDFCDFSHSRPSDTREWVRHVPPHQSSEVKKVDFLYLLLERGWVEIGSDNPAAAVEETLEQRFLEHAEKWDRETKFLSSTPKKVLHESYQSIIAMGPDVIPYLLRDLQKTGRSWFWALRYLAHTDPVPPEDQGYLDKMIADWVAWGKREGRL